MCVCACVRACVRAIIQDTYLDTCQSPKMPLNINCKLIHRVSAKKQFTKKKMFTFASVILSANSKSLAGQMLHSYQRRGKIQLCNMIFANCFKCIRTEHEKFDLILNMCVSEGGLKERSTVKPL